MENAGWGEDWLFYKDIFKIDPMMADDIDFIITRKMVLVKKSMVLIMLQLLRKGCQE